MLRGVDTVMSIETTLVLVGGLVVWGGYQVIEAIVQNRE